MKYRICFIQRVWEGGVADFQLVNIKRLANKVENAMISFLGLWREGNEGATPNSAGRALASTFSPTSG